MGGVRNAIGWSDKKAFYQLGGRYGYPLRESLFDCGYTGRQYEEMGKSPSVLSEYSEGGDCFMEGSLEELAGYRLERAREMLSANA